MFLPSVVIVAQYFDKRRSFATCITAGGAGVGTFIFAPILHLLDDNYGWRFTLIILGILMLVCVPLGILYKPIDDQESGQSTILNDLDANAKQSVCNLSKFDAAVKFCKRITSSMADKGKDYINLFKNARFSIYIFFNFTVNMGMTAPFIFTLVGLNTKIYQKKFIIL